MSGFQNPVIPGFFPDPSVCRAGDEYFLVTSSFTYFPGVPVFQSANLVDWTQVGNVLDRPSQLDLSLTTEYASHGVWAPTIRYHAGRFWMITTNHTASGSRSFFVTTDNPSAPWSDPVPVDIDGVDPDLAWDDDGNCWVSFAAGAGIARCRIDDRTGAVLEPPEPTWSGTGLQFPEAPHLFLRGDTWYLLIAEGGTERGHTVAIARGCSPTGPWEACPANPILTHRSTDHPIQNTGHADLVEATDGSWWMVALGTRPRGFSPKFHVLGRETFLVPVEWVGGWPVVGDLSLEMPASPPGPRGSRPVAVRDDFNASALAPHWISVRAPLAGAASLNERPGWLTLHGNGQGLDADAPVFAGRRQQHHWCRVRARVDPGDSTEAGLAVRMDEERHYEVFRQDGNIAVRARRLRHRLLRLVRLRGDQRLKRPTTGGGGTVTNAQALLLERLRHAGIADVVAVEPATSGLAATAGVARRDDGSCVFVKTFADPPSEGIFGAEADGLTALNELGGLPTPQVLLADEQLLVLSMLGPRPASEDFWTEFAHLLAHLHTSTVHPRFGWHQDNWLGRRRQINTWNDDGFAFFAENRLLRWLGEARVDAALGAAGRAALERLCDRLPELLPAQPACLTHGDLWAHNVLATPDGRPAVIDPAVAYLWPEVDLAHLWTTAPPPEATAFFDLYAELTGLDRDWRERMPIIQLRQHLAVIAQFDHDWGAADILHATLAPFRPHPR